MKYHRGWAGHRGKQRAKEAARVPLLVSLSYISFTFLVRSGGWMRVAGSVSPRL